MLQREMNLVVRKFQVVEEGYYCDGLSARDAKNQMLKVWDGFGFGELEYHSVAAGAALAAREINDTSCLYGFRGQPERIVDIAAELLDLSRQTIVDLLPDHWCSRR